MFRKKPKKTEGEITFVEEEDLEGGEGKAPERIDYMAWLFLLVGIILAGFAAYRVGQAISLDRQLTEARKEHQRLAYVEEKLRQLKEEKARVQKLVDAIEDLRTKKARTVSFFLSFESFIPPSVRIFSLEKRGVEVVVKGYAPSTSAYSTLINALNSSGYFEASIEESRNEGGVFEIKATFNYGKEVKK